MAEFFQLSAAERLDALNAAADKSGVPPHLLEKDLWVVWSLRHLFAGALSGNSGESECHVDAPEASMSRRPIQG